MDIEQFKKLPIGTVLGWMNIDNTVDYFDVKMSNTKLLCVGGSYFNSDDGATFSDSDFKRHIVASKNIQEMFKVTK